MSLYGLIGYPLSHSFSKKYFNEKFEKEGSHDVYELFPVENIAEIHAIINNNPDLCGLNVTIPYKRSVLKYLDDSTAIPKGLSACNCIKITKNRTYGHNTDVVGFERSLKPLLLPSHKKALILGNGGAAEAVKYVLQQNNISYTIVSRDLHHDSTLTYEQLTEAVIADHNIIVNTTPLGMYPSVSSFPAIPYSAITKQHLLYDLVYNPAITTFLQKGEEQGAVIKNGYEMLLIQAEESWKIWND